MCIELLNMIYYLWLDYCNGPAFVRGRLCILFYSDSDAEKYSWGEHFSWQENYAGSSSEIQSPRPVSMMPTRERSATVSHRFVLRSFFFPITFLCFLLNHDKEIHLMASSTIVSNPQLQSGLFRTWG